MGSPELQACVTVKIRTFSWI